MSLDARPRFLPNPTDYCVDVGTILRGGADVFRIDELRDQIAILENCRDISRKQIRTPLLLGAITNGQLVFGTDDDAARALAGDDFNEDDNIEIDDLPLANLSEASKKHFQRAIRYIRELRKRGYTTLAPQNKLIQLELDRIRARFEDPKPARASWVYKWSLELDHANGDVRALVPRFDQRGGSGGKRLDPVIESAIDRVIAARKEDTALKIRAAPMVTDARSILQIEHPERTDLVMAVSPSTMTRRIREAFTEYEICVRNYGKPFARKKYRNWFPRDRAEFPLEVVETDDTDTAIFLVDQLSGLPRGRGYLTGVIDQHSDALHGWELSDQSRSRWSAISAVVHAALPKDPNHPDFAQCETGCEFYGKPGIVVFDNALYNHCDEIELAAESMRIIPAWAKPKTPTEKAMIEGWFKRMKSDFLPTLPGFRGDKKSREDIKAGMASANMGWLEFRQSLIKWTFDQYSIKPQESGWTPRQRWHAGMRFARPRIPTDLLGFKLNACLHHVLRFRPEGIRLDRQLIFNCSGIDRLRKQHGHNSKAKFRYHPHDLGEIYVLDTALKVYIPVPSVNPEYTRGLSLFQHKLVLKMCKENGIKNPSMQDMLRFREQLRILTAQLRHSKKMKEVTRAAKTGDVPVAGKSKNAPQPGTMIVTTLEERIDALDLIEMEEGDDGWTLPSTY